MKAQIEWIEGNAWKQSTVEMKSSRIGNNYFTHDGSVYVFASFRQGCEVVTKTKEGWTKAGRICRNVVFLGDGLSYSETCEEKFKNETKWERPVFA
jgi:hypothetical protein